MWPVCVCKRVYVIVRCIQFHTNCVCVCVRVWNKVHIIYTNCVSSSPLPSQPIHYGTSACVCACVQCVCARV